MVPLWQRIDICSPATIIRNLAVPRHFIAYLVFISSIRVDPGPTNRGPTSLLALKIRTPVANTGEIKVSFIIACVSFSELENDTLNQAELNEIKINENN
jgi:hypothetical protein